MISQFAASQMTSPRKRILAAERTGEDVEKVPENVDDADRQFRSRTDELIAQFRKVLGEHEVDASSVRRQTIAWTDIEYLTECRVTKRSDEKCEVSVTVQDKEVAMRRFANEAEAHAEAERIRSLFLD